MSAPNVPGPTAPHYVLTSRTDATAVLHRLARQGWRTRRGFALTGDGHDLARDQVLLFGRVTDLHGVRQVVRAAQCGAAVLAVADGQVQQALLADLGRLGPVCRSAEAPGDNAVPLLPEQRALLQRLANGETIASAAAAEYLSLRTANRRIAQARQALGVTSTREAVRVFVTGLGEHHPETSR